MMAEQGGLADGYRPYQMGCGVDMDMGMQETAMGMTEDPGAADPLWIQPSSMDMYPHAQAEQDQEAMGEAMVDDLVGEEDDEQKMHAPSRAGGVSSLANPFLEDISDAFHKVDAA